MQTINIKDYNASMGPLIDVEDASVYKIKHVNGAINIPYLELSYHFQNLLDKNKHYYIYCNAGHKSRRIVSILEIYGYKVTQVLL